jgi:hypothetical protein
MIAKTVIATAVALAAGNSLQTFAASFDAKPGAWQMSMNTLIVGNPLPPEALASMPPEKRAKVEKAMKERAAKPVALSHKTCVTKEDLDQDRIIPSDKDDGRCTRKVLSRSTTRIVMEQTCREPNASTSQMTIEAMTPESLSANIVRVRGDGKGKVLIDVKGFWLGPSCAGIKDDD